MNTTISIKIIAIIALCTVWIIFLPGYVAFKNNVFYGWMFKDRIPDSLIISRTSNEENAYKIFDKKKLLSQSESKSVKVFFSGFAEHGLNYVWLESYIILCIYAFVVYYTFPFKKINSRTIVASLIIMVLFHVSTWIRNFSEIGKYGRTIYTFVNYDIDKTSYWLQEFRGYFFSFLLSVYWYQFELKQKETSKIIKHSLRDFDIKKYIFLTNKTKSIFNNWQRDIIVSIVLFLPWTWFYWRNIYYHGDTRYIFPAIIFHSFWVISIILLSLPFLQINFTAWRSKNRIIYKEIQENSKGEMINYLKDLEPLPKGQFFLTSFTTAFSLFSPFLQFIFTK